MVGDVTHERRITKTVTEYVMGDLRKTVCHQGPYRANMNQIAITT